MAWIYSSGGFGGESGDIAQHWYNTETGEISFSDPNQISSGRVDIASNFQGESGGGIDPRFVDAVSGAAVSDQNAASQQYIKQLDDEFNAVIRNPNSTAMQRVQAIEKRYGIEAVAQLTSQGYFADVPNLGQYIASRQREGEAEGFSINDNQLGLWPVIIGMAAGGFLSGTEGAGVGAGASEGASVGAGEFGGLESIGVGATPSGAGSATGGSSVVAGTSASPAVAGAGVAASSPSEIGMEGVFGNPSEIGFEGAGVAGGGNAAAGGTSGGGLTAGQAAGGASSGSSALSNLLSGSGTASDWLDLAGRLAPSVLGAYASNRQANSLEDLANKYFDVGGPSRARFEGSFAPGFTMEMDPGYKDAIDQTTKSFLHKASVTGNPVDSPNAWMQTLKDVNSTFAFPALNEYRRVNAGAGGMAALTSAAPSLDSASVNAQRGVYDSLGAGAADIFTPRKSLADLLREARY